MRREIHKHKFPPDVAKKALADTVKYGAMLRLTDEGDECKIATRTIEVLEPDDLEGVDLGSMSAVYACACFERGQKSLVNEDIDKSLRERAGIAKVSQKTIPEPEDMLEI